jgi:nitrite reductase (NADH) small subunit
VKATTVKTTWTDVCAVDSLIPGRGVAAMVAGEQVAIFLVDGDLYAVGNHDPFSDAYVMSRGIVGTKGGVTKVASPMYKQTFDLRTGVCFEKPEVSIPVWAIRCVDGRVEVSPA